MIESYDRCDGLSSYEYDEPRSSTRIDGPVSWSLRSDIRNSGHCEWQFTFAYYYYYYKSYFHILWMLLFVHRIYMICLYGLLLCLIALIHQPCGDVYGLHDILDWFVWVKSDTSVGFAIDVRHIRYIGWLCYRCQTYEIHRLALLSMSDR